MVSLAFFLILLPSLSNSQGFQNKWFEALESAGPNQQVILREFHPGGYLVAEVERMEAEDSWVVIEADTASAAAIWTTYPKACYRRGLRVGVHLPKPHSSLGTFFYMSKLTPTLQEALMSFYGKEDNDPVWITTDELIDKNEIRECS